MKISTPMLAQQIQRLFISEEDKKRLLEEVEKLSDDKKLHLVEVIQEHDAEAMGLLNKKANEVGKIKEELVDQMPGKDLSEEEKQKIYDQLKEHMKSPEKLAELVAVSDDYMLSQIEEIISEGLKKNPELQQQSRLLFQELRLQKAAFVNDAEGKQNEMLKKAVLERKEQSETLDSLIAKAGSLLGKDYK